MSSWKDIASVITAAVAVIALISGYVRFVLQRAVMPCVEFDVDFSALRSGPGRHQGEIVLTVKNVGPGSGFVADVQGRVRYAEIGEDDVGRDAIEPALPHYLEAAPEFSPESRLILPKGFLFTSQWEPAFIQPGVTQVYRKPVALPGEADLVHVWAAFRYTIQAGPLTRFLVRVSAHHAKAGRPINYTVRRSFAMPR
jgi:hypothetical protein